MKARMFIIISCMGFLFIPGCKVDCPAFPEHLADYFPYRTNDTLLFVNQNNDSVLFVVYIIEKAKEHSFGRRCKCECDSRFYFKAHVNNWTFLEGNIGVYSKPEIYVDFGDGYWDIATTTNSFLSFYEETGKNPFDSKNSFLFGEIIILENSENQISRVMIMKGKGIMEFYDQRDSFHWKSINK